MAAPLKAWNKVVAADVERDVLEQFKRETEVQVRLIVKPSRDYIYELLTKTRYPLSNIEAIIERRGNLVDFTCKDRGSAEALQRLLGKHPNVKEARLFESEFTDVKLSGVPHRLPDGNIIAFLNKRNGEVLSTKRLKDRRGFFDGRRIYKMRSVQLQERPIPQTIRVCGCSIQTDYYGQPARCYLCKKFGHMKSDCPEAVRTPPAIFFNQDFDTTTIPTPGNDGEKKIPVNNASTPLETEPNNLQETRDTLPRNPEEQTGQNERDDLQVIKTAVAQQDGTDPTDCVSEFSSSSSEAGEIPEESIFSTDEETRDTGNKRQHSPETAIETKKPKATGENYDCVCGCPIILPTAAGCFAPCECGIYYTRCFCSNVISTNGDKPAHCEVCHKRIPRPNLDMTV